MGGAIFGAARRAGHLRPAWRILIAYVVVALLHAAFDSTGGIVGYVIVSGVGLVPLVWLWWRADGPNVTVPDSRAYPGF